MYFPTVAVAAIAGASLVGAAPIINARKAAPTGWAHNVLEDYNTYHVRYLALECYTQHNTTFFDDCCHPLRASESLSDSKEYCTPNATALASASARVAAASATATVAGDAAPSAAVSDDTAQQYVSDSFATTVASEEAPASTWAPASSAAPTSTTPAWQEAAAQPTEQATQDAPSSADAPTSTSTKEAAPTTQEEQPTSTQQAQSQETSSSSSSGSSTPSGTTYTGEGTWYLQSEGADPSGKGSCGYTNTDADYIAAISTVGSSWGNTQCGKMITVQNNANGKTVQVEIVDNCPTCASANSLDLSQPAFEAIADLSTGVIDITWWFN